MSEEASFSKTPKESKFISSRILFQKIKIFKAKGEEAQLKLAKQAFDLAKLSQGLLTGKDLTPFVKRSVEII